MDTLRVSRLRSRYRLRARAVGERGRLDGVLRSVIDDALEHALSRSGVPPDEEVCIRAVHVPVRLRLGASDSALAAAWSVALAESIRRAVVDGGAEMVRYPTRSAALADLLAGVAAADLRRAWAWRQLGWAIEDGTPPAPAADAAVRALLAEPFALVASVAGAAEAGALPALASLIPRDAWSQIARAAIGATDPLPTRRSHGTSNALARSESPDERRDGSGSTITNLPIHPALERRAERMIERSAIGRALRATGSPLAGGTPPEAVSALALLIVLEAEPAELRRGGTHAGDLVAAVARIVSAEPTPDPMTTPSTGRPDPRVRDADGTGRSDLAARVPAARTEPERKSASRAEPAGGVDVAHEPEERPIPAAARAARTSWGGLLFLLQLVDRLGLPAEILASDAFRRRTLRWVLHRVALRLLDLADDDPAALAFAGLAPCEPPPGGSEEPPTAAEEEAALDELGRRLAAELHLAVEGEAAPGGRTALAGLRRRARRDAEIVAYPGWIDVRLRLDEVAVELRRAGLDLDPGWIPWLGVVMRFVYE